VRKLKEFWLQPSSTTLESLQRLVRDARPDVILLEERIPDLNTKIASRRGDADIILVSDMKQLASAKNTKSCVAFEISVKDRKDHEKVVHALELRPDYVLVECLDWRVIPLENLIAESKGTSKLLACTRSFEESRLALNCLERGADGIVLSSSNDDEILKTRDLVAGESLSLILEEARITSVREIGTGSRVCVDTVEIIAPGEGLLTGCSSSGLFLIEGEVNANPHVNPRPFRVNAGPVSLYVLSGEGKTCYLSELAAGETVLLVDASGNSRTVDVARVKIERRPMLLIEASSGDRIVKTIVQNAETVRLITPEGSKQVSELKPGDEVLVRLEQGGRHFGTRVADEMIIER
jgi:3-dehydroquinate synthase II